MTSSTLPGLPPKNLSHAMLRGALGRCPHCGTGRLFARYLRPVEQCSACGERFGHIRADDGPAWLTILLVGHILGPFILIFARDESIPAWINLTVWPVLALALTFAILPRAKGTFIAIIWRIKCWGVEG